MTISRMWWSCKTFNHLLFKSPLSQLFPSSSYTMCTYETSGAWKANSYMWGNFKLIVCQKIVSFHHMEWSWLFFLPILLLSQKFIQLYIFAARLVKMSHRCQHFIAGGNISIFIRVHLVYFIELVERYTSDRFQSDMDSTRQVVCDTSARQRPK